MAVELNTNGATETKKQASKEAGKAFKAQGESARASMSEQEKALEGSKRDKVSFICALGNPAKSQVRVQDGKQIPSCEVVGYKFNLAEPMMVPNAPIKEGFKNILDVEPATEIQAPAGEIVLNLVETGMFISKLEFAGQFTGGDKPVSLTAKMSQGRPDPLPTLRLTDPKGSIKVGMDEIATMVGDENGGKGKPQIKDEYRDKFAVIYTKRSAGRKGTGAAKKKGETSADIAAAFRQYFANKNA